MNKKKMLFSSLLMVSVMLSVIFGHVKEVHAGPMAGFDYQNTSHYEARYTRALQVMLLNYDEYTQNKIAFNGGADGSFGPATEKAVKHFQTATGLTSDGSCGPATWQKFYTKLQSLGVSGSWVNFTGLYPYESYSMRHSTGSTMTWNSYYYGYWHYVE
jgi:peptidoglycan hydrolase-like protein with peptidoglycan-binding domain